MSCGDAEDLLCQVGRPINPADYYYECTHFVAGALVRYTDYRGLGYCGMTKKRRFHLARRNKHPAALEQVVLTAEVPKIAVLVLAHHIAGVVEVPPVSGAPFVPVPVIATEHAGIVPMHHDPARFAGRYFV